MTLRVGAAGVVDMMDREKAAEIGRIRRVKEEGLRMREGREKAERGRVFIAEAMVDGRRVRGSYARRSTEKLGEVIKYVVVSPVRKRGLGMPCRTGHSPPLEDTSSPLWERPSCSSLATPVPCSLAITPTSVPRSHALP